jgi:hypothetical protein
MGLQSIQNKGREELIGILSLVFSFSLKLLGDLNPSRIGIHKLH